MAIEVVNGRSSHSGTTIPYLFSRKLLVKFYSESTVANITNLDYQGEIANYGDKVIINTVPDITVRDYVIGQDLIDENPTSGIVTLNIDRAAYYNFTVNTVDKAQSLIDIQGTWTADANHKMIEKVETTVFSTIYAEASSTTSGATAGAYGTINLGVTGTPLAFTASTCLQILMKASTALTQNKVPKDGRFVVLPSWATSVIRMSDMKNVYITGDSVTPLRGGAVGRIAGFELFESDNVYTSHGEFFPVFGTKHAVAFASQITKSEVITNPSDFGEKFRALKVYGFKTIKPEALGTLCISES